MREYAFWLVFVTVLCSAYVIAVIAATIQGHYEPLIGSLIGGSVLAILAWCIRADARNR